METIDLIADKAIESSHDIPTGSTRDLVVPSAFLNQS